MSVVESPVLDALGPAMLIALLEAMAASSPLGEKQRRVLREAQNRWPAATPADREQLCEFLAERLAQK